MLYIHTKVGEPKPDRIRIVADKIEDNPFWFNQCSLGPSFAHRKHIGTGVGDDHLPGGNHCPVTKGNACVAGFAVQYLGNLEEYEEIRREFASRGVSLFRDGLGGCDVEKYSTILLGLPSEWANAIYTTMWPAHWLNLNVALTPKTGYFYNEESDVRASSHGLLQAKSTASCTIPA